MLSYKNCGRQAGPFVTSAKEVMSFGIAKKSRKFRAILHNGRPQDKKQSVSFSG